MMTWFSALAIIIILAGFVALVIESKILPTKTSKGEE
jgi:hypothetical protein